MQKRLENPLWTALVTPLDHHYQIDLHALDLLIERQERAGNGILLLGSTGEGLAFTTDQKKHLIEHVIERGCRVPVMACVGGHQLEEQVKWIRFCQKLGVDTFLLSPPLYSRPGDCGQTMWFQELLDAAEKPCLIYNHPGRSGVWLSAKACKALKDHPNLWGVKDAGGDLARFVQYREALPTQTFYVGCDENMFSHAAEGAAGLISVMSNLWPLATRRYIEECKLGQRNAIVDLGEQGALYAGKMNPISSKKILYQKGLLATENLLPPLSADDVILSEEGEAIDRALEVLESEKKVTV